MTAYDKLSQLNRMVLGDITNADLTSTNGYVSTLANILKQKHTPTPVVELLVAVWRTFGIPTIARDTMYNTQITPQLVAQVYNDVIAASTFESGSYECYYNDGLYVWGNDRVTMQDIEIALSIVLDKHPLYNTLAHVINNESPNFLIDSDFEFVNEIDFQFSTLANVFNMFGYTYINTQLTDGAIVGKVGKRYRVLDEFGDDRVVSAKDVIPLLLDKWILKEF